MTRTYALHQLLKLGAMTHREIKECTRWTDFQVGHAIERLLLKGLIVRYRQYGKRYTYEAKKCLTS
jgi:predicted transcriptional regulator